MIFGFLFWWQILSTWLIYNQNYYFSVHCSFLLLKLNYLVLPKNQIILLLVEVLSIDSPFSIYLSQRLSALLSYTLYSCRSVCASTVKRLCEKILSTRSLLKKLRDGRESRRIPSSPTSRDYSVPSRPIPLWLRKSRPRTGRDGICTASRGALGPTIKDVRGEKGSREGEGSMVSFSHTYPHPLYRDCEVNS